MSKARVVVSKVVSKQMSVSEAAAAYGVSRQHVHRWLARYRDGGFDGLEPRSRRPHSKLWQIEKSFRMSKTDLRARPIYHHKRESIEAHLTIVFAALAVS
jgi:transposase